MTQGIKPEMMSRRKALSLLGFGAAFGFALSSALEPLEAEAQEAAAPTAAPAEATGTHGTSMSGFTPEPSNRCPPQVTYSAFGITSMYP